MEVPEKVVIGRTHAAHHHVDEVSAVTLSLFYREVS
jgi:hypothetical protein